MKTMGHENTRFDFKFCFEFAMKTLGYQNTRFVFKFCFEFAMRTMGHHVTRCYHKKYKVKSEKIIAS